MILNTLRMELSEVMHMGGAKSQHCRQNAVVLCTHL